MTAVASRRGLAPLLWSLIVVACAPSAPPGSPAPQPSAEVMAAAAVADSVRNSFTDADVEFMSGMIGHHAQAIVMSEMAPTHGAGDDLQILAARVINAQRDEIALMQNWLRNNGLAVPETGHDGMKNHSMLMPGMLTQEQMDELDAARGVEFDRLFLRRMIMHHQGALTMVEKLFASHGAAQNDRVFKFASDVGADQSTEVARMQLMLVRLLGATDSQ